MHDPTDGLPALVVGSTAEFGIISLWSLRWMNGGLAPTEISSERMTSNGQFDHLTIICIFH